MSYDELLKENFQFYKSVGIGISLLLVVLAQMLFPNRLALRELLGNWKVNVPMAVLNSLLMALFCGACVCTWAVTVRDQGIGFFALGAFPSWLEVLGTLILLDFVAWIWHRANHHWSFLWRFHSVHHSDRRFEALTAFRFHPGELFISLGVRLAVVTLTALPILGLILFEVVYGFFNLFVHSDTRLPARWENRLGWIFVTPSLHRIHHSNRSEELNRNFGTIFSLWDRLAHTYSYASSSTRVELGLPEQASDYNVRAALALPFRGDRKLE